jgi:hypothetical protein
VLLLFSLAESFTRLNFSTFLLSEGWDPTGLAEPLKKRVTKNQQDEKYVTLSSTIEKCPLPPTFLFNHLSFFRGKERDVVGLLSTQLNKKVISLDHLVFGASIAAILKLLI